MNGTQFQKKKLKINKHVSFNLIKRNTPANNNYTIRLDGCDCAKNEAEIGSVQHFLVPCACGRSLFEIVSPSIADDKGTTDSGKGRRKHDDGADVQKRVEGRMC